MSRCCCKCKKNNNPYMPVMGVGMSPVKENNSCCNFPCFIILILILLQFGKKNNPFQEEGVEGCNNSFGIDKGILFIIALYYLSCCNPCA